MICKQCGAPANTDYKFCEYCGAEVEQPVHNVQENNEFKSDMVSEVKASIKINTVNTVHVRREPVKSKITAGILALLLGGLGIHKFYLGKIFQGIIYLLFCWLYIPALIALVEGIIYLVMDDEKWMQKVGYREIEY